MGFLVEREWGWFVLEKGELGKRLCVCVEVGFGGEWKGSGGLFEKCYLYCYIDTRFCSDVGHRGGIGVYIRSTPSPFPPSLP